MEATFEVQSVLAGAQETLSTSYGPLVVTIYGDRSRSPCIAYHEVGLNHQSCFRSLIVASGPQSLFLKNFYIVFIDAPGCQVGFILSPWQQFQLAVGVVFTRPSRLLQSADAPVPVEVQPVSLEKLSTQVYEVAQLLTLRECLGLGVGNGAHILTRCAAEHPRLFAGLVLISPSCRPAGWWEWVSGKAAAAHLYYRGWCQAVREHLAHRLFSPATLQLLGGDSDLLRAFHREVVNTSASGVEHYLRAALARKDLTPLLAKLRCRVLLLYGAEGLYEQDCLHLASAVDKSRFAMMEIVHAGVLVNEERPAELLSPLQLFLTALQLEGVGLGAALQVGE